MRQSDANNFCLVEASRERSEDDVPPDGGNPHLVPVQDPRLWCKTQRYSKKWREKLKVVFMYYVWCRQNLFMGYTKEYWVIYRGPGFLAVVWFGSAPTHFHPLFRQQVIFLSQFSCVPPYELNNGRGGEGEGRGWARSQIIRPRESLALYYHSTLSGVNHGGKKGWRG